MKADILLILASIPASIPGSVTAPGDQVELMMAISWLDKHDMKATHQINSAQTKAAKNQGQPLAKMGCNQRMQPKCKMNATRMATDEIALGFVFDIDRALMDFLRVGERLLIGIF